MISMGGGWREMKQGYGFVYRLVAPLVHLIPLFALFLRNSFSLCCCSHSRFFMRCVARILLLVHVLFLLFISKESEFFFRYIHELLFLFFFLWTNILISFGNSEKVGKGENHKNIFCIEETIIQSFNWN